jgi:hypothetical protein
MPGRPRPEEETAPAGSWIAMNVDLDQLERLAEQELRHLPHLPPVTLPADRLARIKAAVAAESLRLRRRERVLRVVRRVSGVAAAIGLACLLYVRPASVTPAPPGIVEGEPSQLLFEWVESIEDSSERMTAVIDGSWMWRDAERPMDEADFDDLLQGLEQSSESELGV